MSENLFLIGFMGTGKSTVAGTLHAQYHLKHLEMDRMIEEGEGKSIPKIFEEDGEEYFRQLETNLIRSFESNRSLVISCGGGAAMRPENVKLMQERGTVVYLTAMPETIYERVRHSHHRPLLEGHMNLTYIQELMSKREEKYRQAAQIVISTDGRSAQEIADEIMRNVSQKIQN